MAKDSKPIMPVKPEGMEIVYYYPCPHCQRKIALASPTQPIVVRCEGCSGRFPIVPVDARTVSYIKTMSANGKAATDPDFV